MSQRQRRERERSLSTGGHLIETFSPCAGTASSVLRRLTLKLK